MGTVISKGANGFGAIIGSAFIAPFRTLLGGSCEGVCSGTWDLMCFIEHFCIPNLLKLVMVLALSYAMLLFFYLLFKLGVIQCIVKGCCKMSSSACEAYYSAVEGICCLIWLKLKSTKRVYRGRRDAEKGFSSSEETDSSDGYRNINVLGRRRSARDKLKYNMWRSLYPVRHRAINKGHARGNHHDLMASVHSKKRFRRPPTKRNTSIQSKPFVKRRRVHR